MGKFMGKNQDGKKYKNNYVWLDKSGKKPHLVRFLEYLATSDADEVVMVGDVLDDWIVPVDVVPPSFLDILNHAGNRNTVNALRALSDAKNVRYLPGNHDMLVDSASIHAKFPMMTFGGNHDYGLQYIDGNVVTEHGTSSAMFNGPDHEHGLPLGYFISRMIATYNAYTDNEGDMDLFSVAGSVIRGFVDGDLTDKRKLIGLVVSAVCKATGLNLNTKILMRPDAPVDTGGRGYITVKDVKGIYADLAVNWKKGPDHLLPAIPAADVDCHNVELMVKPLCDGHLTGVAVMGHTHDETNIYSKKSRKGYAYSNCGCWCKKTVSVTDPSGETLSSGNGHFVTTVDTSGKTTATLYYWDEKESAPKGDGNPVVYPKPSHGPMQIDV